MNDEGTKWPGKQFEPGVNAYQASRPQELIQAKRLNKTEVERILIQYLNKPIAELNTDMKDPMKTALEVLVIQILVQAIKKGDHQRLDFLLDRIIGKAKDKSSDFDESKSFHEQVVDFVESYDADFKRIE